MKTITTGQKDQKDQITTFVKDAARKATEEAIAELEAGGALNGDNLQRIIEKGDHVSAEVKKFLKEMFAKLAETLTIDPTIDTELISKSKDVFDGWIDPDFKNYGCNVKGKPTELVNVQVLEMIKDGDFKKIYGGVSDNLDALCLSQGQIIQFCREHRNWLRTDGYGTFFLFKEKGQFFVAYVYFGSGGLRVRRLSYGAVCFAGCPRRFVVPQLILEN